MPKTHNANPAYQRLPGSPSHSRLSCLAATAALALAALGLPACGSENSADSGDGLAEAGTPTASPTPTPNTRTFKANHTFTARATQADDTESEYVWEIGEKSSAKGPQIPDGFALDACEIDSARDLVMPFRFTGTNLTTGFPSRMLPLLSIGDPNQGGMTVSFATTLSGSPLCKDGSLLLEFSDVQPGAESSIEGTLVLHDYYTPETPDGNDESYEALQGAMGRINCLSGPGSANGVFHLTGADFEEWGSGMTEMESC